MPKVTSRIVDVYPFRRNGGRIEFLLLRRSPGLRLGDTWQCVHGRIEEGETASQAARRELAEETGLSPTGFWQIDYVNTFYVASDDAIMMCPCFAVEVSPDASVRLSAEHTAYEWVAMFAATDRGSTGIPTAWEPDERAIEKLMWPGQRAAVREIVAEIVSKRVAEPHLRISPSRS